MKPRIFLLTLALVFAFPSAGHTADAKTFQKSRALIDTFVTITAVSDSPDRADAAIDRAFSVIERFGDLIDFYKDTSELSEINRNAGIKPVRVSRTTFELIEAALVVSRNTGGAFDPTIGPVMKLWDFPRKKRPAESEIRKTLPLVNYRNVVTDKANSTVFLKKKGMLLDLGGIAKGFAADLAVADMKANGISAGIVAIAGDIRTFGKKPNGSDWNIGVKNPRRKTSTDELVAKVRLSDRAISTSGDYERFFMIGSERFHHLLDPKTGHPARGCISVSVISDRGVLSDGYDNAVFILGPERGLNLVRKMGFDAIIVDKDEKVIVTDGLKDSTTVEKKH
ncbi:MAG: FAD:protein FMN transferase [Thermodesulfovibrionales bacterium]